MFIIHAFNSNLVGLLLPGANKSLKASLVGLKAGFTGILLILTCTSVKYS